MNMIATAISQPSYGYGGWKDCAPVTDTKPSVATTLVLALLAGTGTGGYADGRYWLQRQDMGYFPLVIQVHGQSDDLPQPDTATPANQIALVRDVIKPAMTELAAAFGVTRQTMYNWANAEKQPAPEHAARLEDLATAAQHLVAAGFSGSAISRRKISDGKTLLQLVQEGASATKTADKLIATLRKEVDQRARMTARLAGRKPNAAHTEDAGSPMLHEQA